MSWLITYKVLLQLTVRSAAQLSKYSPVAAAKIRSFGWRVVCNGKEIGWAPSFNQTVARRDDGVDSGGLPGTAALGGTASEVVARLSASRETDAARLSVGNGNSQRSALRSLSRLCQFTSRVRFPH